MIELEALPSHARSDGLDGYLYVIEFSTGLVKVGMTRNPKARMRSHADEAARFGCVITSLWLSDQHENYRENEAELISALGQPQHGSEYFQIAFTTAVAAAKRLVYRCLSLDELEDRRVNNEARAKAAVDSLRTSFGRNAHVNIRVPADEAGPLQLIYTDGLPDGFAPPKEGDSEAIPPLLKDLTEKSGIARRVIAGWSYIDILQYVATTAIKVRCLRLQHRALLAGRDDLTTPAWADYSGDYEQDPGFSHYAEPAELLGESRDVIVGLGSADEVEYAYLSVGGTATGYAEILLTREQLGRLIDTLSETFGAMDVES